MNKIDALEASVLVTAQTGSMMMVMTLYVGDAQHARDTSIIRHLSMIRYSPERCETMLSKTSTITQALFVAIRHHEELLTTVQTFLDSSMDASRRFENIL